MAMLHSATSTSTPWFSNQHKLINNWIITPPIQDLGVLPRISSLGLLPPLSRRHWLKPHIKITPADIGGTFVVEHENELGTVWHTPSHVVILFRHMTFSW
jgi:hypothetical protein